MIFYTSLKGVRDNTNPKLKNIYKQRLVEGIKPALHLDIQLQTYSDKRSCQECSMSAKGEQVN